MSRIPVLLFATVFCATLILVSCGQNEKPRESKRSRSLSIVRSKFVKPAPPSQGYVGSEACRACHAEIMKEYESHPMSISMSVTADFAVETYPTESPVDAGQGAQWVARKSDDQVVHQEQVLDDQGQEIVQHVESIDFTCGSGTRGCSYFVFRSGKLYQSPLTWYAQQSRWDLSPGFQLPHHPRFERTASDGCMACHAGRMNPIPDERHKFFAQEPFHELAIGCERCHGPAAEHIAYHETGANQPGKVDPIVNPDKLTPKQREAVCYQCHLQGERRVVRYGRTEFDFRPGMHLSDVWITFLKSGEATGGQAEAVSQVEQMHQSECFIQSQGKMGCISCHDPHRSPTEETRIEFYRTRCLDCHSGNAGREIESDCTMDRSARLAQTPEDSCIQCHMPRLQAEDVAHTAQTNHRVHIPGKPFQPPADATTDGFRVWNDQQVPPSAIERARTIALGERAWLQDDPALADLALQGLPSFHPPADDDLELRETMAQLFFIKQDRNEAFRIWNDLLKRFPRDESLLVQVSLVLHQAGELEKAYPLYQQLEKVNNSNPHLLQRHLDVCAQLGKSAEATRIAKRIIELNPGSRFAHQWLARYYRQRGDTAQADYHDDVLKRLPSP